MAGPNSLSLEDLARLYNVRTVPLLVGDLETGMVVPILGKPRIVISVSYERVQSGPMVIVETSLGLERCPLDSRLGVWHLDGAPFFVDVPPEDLGPYTPGASGGGSTPPAHDAAGIVPVWRGPKRLN